MFEEGLWVSVAFVLGLVARGSGLPPLVGFLVAGFGLHAFGAEPGPLLVQASHVGVLLLLFTVGLKVRLQTIVRPECWASGLLHLAITVGVFTPVVHWLGGVPLGTAVLLSAALGFSSTVLAAKILEEKRELRAFHGRVAIGILIAQDLVVVTVLALSSETAPSPYAIGLLALPLARPLLHRVLDASGHGELLPLYGMLLALTVGGLGFELLGMSSELGALVTGVLVAGHGRAQELSRALWGLKEVFLVGFFLQIGFYGLPSAEVLTAAVVLSLLLVGKAVLFFGLLLLFKLRARTAFLCALTLTSYSEFGLIAAHLGVQNGWLDQRWLVLLGVTVALSFVIGAAVNRVAHQIYERFEAPLCRFERAARHPDDEPISLGSREIVIVGMGRVGTGAYDFLTRRGELVVGLDSDPEKVLNHVRSGRRVLFADAEDPGFWQRLELGGIRAVLLSMPDLEAKRMAAANLRRRAFGGLISATNVFPEEVPAILDAGVDTTFNYFDEAGVGFAEHTWEALHPG